MADVTIDDVLSFLKGTVAPYDGNLPQSVMPPKRNVNPTTAFDKPAGRTPPSIEEIVDTITRGGKPYDNNLPNGGPPRARPEFNKTTKGDIEAAKAKDPTANLSAEELAAIVKASGGGEAGAPTGALPGAKASGGLPAWLSEYVQRAKGAHQAVTGPIRAAANAVAIPATAAYDLGKRVLYGAFGLEPEAPMGNTGERMAGVMEGLGDTVAPFRGAGDAIKAKLVEAGGRPLPGSELAGAFGGNPAAKSVVEGVPSAGPVNAPAARAARGPAQGVGTTASPQPQGGAFAAPSAPVAQGGGAGGVGQGNVAAAETAQPAAKSLAEEFRKRSGEIGRDANGDLTPEQKAQAELNFFLGLMAKSAQPGARMLGAFGESGQESLKGVDAQRDKNLSRSEKKIQQARDDLYKEMGFENMDRDDKRADRRATTEEKRYAAAEGRDKERLQLERDKLKADGQSVRETKVNEQGYYVHFLKDGSHVVSKVKAKASATDGDPVKKAMDTIGGYFPNETTEERWDRMIGLKRDTGKGADALERDSAKKLADFTAKVYADSMIEPAAAKQKIAVYRQSLGLPTEPGGAGKPSTEADAHTMAKDAIKKGKDPAAVNKRLQEWGYKPL